MILLLTFNIINIRILSEYLYEKTIEKKNEHINILKTYIIITFFFFFNFISDSSGGSALTLLLQSCYRLFKLKQVVHEYIN